MGQIAAALVSATILLTASAQAQAVYSEDFDDGMANGFTLPDLWNVTENFPNSGTHALGFVQGATPGSIPNGNFEGNWTSTAFSGPIELPEAASVLSLRTFLHGEGGDTYDQLFIGVSLDGIVIDQVVASSRFSDNFTLIPSFDGTNEYTLISLSLADYADQTVYLSFQFVTGDDIANGFPGPRIDDIAINTDVDNQPPVAADDTATLTRVRSTIDVLANDTDPDNDDLTIIAVESNEGNVSTDGKVLIYFSFSATGSDTIDYVVADPSGAQSRASVEISVDIPNVITTDVLFKGATGGAAKAPGDEVPGEPEGVTFKTVGIPDINDHGNVAFTAILATPDGNQPAIFDGLKVVARKGDPAPGLVDAQFTSFKDPALDNDGDVVFRGKVAGAGVTSANSQVLVANHGGSLATVVRTGDEIPGVDGSQLATIKGFITSNDVVYFTGLLLNKTAGTAPGPGGVTSADDLVLCSWTPTDGTELILREGQSFDSRTVKTFSALNSSSGSPGHGRNSIDDDTVLTRIGFTDSTQAIVEFETEFEESGPVAAAFTETSIIAESGEELFEDGPVYKRFGLPINTSEGGVAALTTFVTGTAGITSANNVSLVSDLENDPESVLDKGLEVDTGIYLYSFKDPVVNENNDFAILSGLKGPGLSSANNKVIVSVDDGSSNVLARLGDESVGVPEARWKSFKSVALPDSMGPIFVASMVTGAGGTAGPGDVVSTTDIGLWGVDTTNELRLLLREGDTIDVDGASKTVKSFKTINAVSGSSGQTRSFNELREIVALATFSDSSKAILRITIPPTDSSD